MSGKWVPKTVQDRAASAPILLAASASQENNGTFSVGKMAAAVATIREPKPEECEESFHVAENEIMGCSHYARKCKLYAACCDSYVSCRFCHDEASDHNLDR